MTTALKTFYLRYPTNSKRVEFVDHGDMVTVTEMVGSRYTDQIAHTTKENGRWWYKEYLGRGYVKG